MRISTKILITDNYYFSMQKRVEMKDYYLRGKDKGRVTVVPSEGNQMRTRSSGSKQNDPGKKEELSIRRSRERKIKD